MEKPDSQSEAEPKTPFETMRLDKTAFSVVDLGDETADKAYWWSLTPLERLEALEWMRQVAYGHDPLNDRIQRVLEVVKHPPRNPRPDQGEES